MNVVAASLAVRNAAVVLFELLLTYRTTLLDGLAVRL
jgi:hypothetical protein